jgi:hypothetical protein
VAVPGPAQLRRQRSAGRRADAAATRAARCGTRGAARRRASAAPWARACGGTPPTACRGAPAPGGRKAEPGVERVEQRRADSSVRAASAAWRTVSCTQGRTAPSASAPRTRPRQRRDRGRAQRRMGHRFHRSAWVDMVTPGA